MAVKQVPQIPSSGQRARYFPSPAAGPVAGEGSRGSRTGARDGPRGNFSRHRGCRAGAAFPGSRSRNRPCRAGRGTSSRGPRRHRRTRMPGKHFEGLGKGNHWLLDRPQDRSVIPLGQMDAAEAAGLAISEGHVRNGAPAHGAPEGRACNALDPAWFQRPPSRGSPWISRCFAFHSSSSSAVRPIEA